MLSSHYQRQTLKIASTILIACCLLALGFYRYVDQPLIKHVQADQQKIQSLQAGEQAETKKIPTLVVDGYAPWLRAFQQAQVGVLKSRLLSLLHASRVMVQKVSFTKVNQTATDQQLPVQLKLQGSYQSLMHLFVKLMNAKQVFDVKKFELQAGKGGLELDLNLLLLSPLSLQGTK